MENKSIQMKRIIRGYSKPIVFNFLKNIAAIFAQTEGVGYNNCD